MRVPALNADGREIAQAVRELATGGTNAAGTFTLAASATTTVVKDDLATPGCRVLFSPLSANAATAGAFHSSTASGSFTITHTSSTATDRAFDYLILHG